MIFPAEIREIVVVGNAFLRPLYFSELDGLVPSDLDLRGLKLERGIPGTTIRPAKPATVRMGVREGRIDDAVTRNVENEFICADAREQVVLR